MSKLEQDVRAAAAAFKEAITAAEAGGYRVTWPHRAAELDRMAISQTKRVEDKPAAIVADKPVTFGTAKVTPEKASPQA